MSTYKVGYFIGSLATASINRKLAAALVRLAPAELELTEIPIRDLPLYSYDYDADYPAEGRVLKDAIASVDAVLFVTPEYNRSIPGGLKNALDWASRPHGTNAFTGKPSAVIGASTGAVGTALAQQHLRGALAFSDSPQMAQPEGYIQFAEGLIADDGQVANEGTADFLRTWMAAFHAFIQKQLDPRTPSPDSPENPDTLENLDTLDLRALPGSERRPVPDVAGATAEVDPGTEIEVTLILRRRASVPDTAYPDTAFPGTAFAGAAFAAPMSVEELADRYGADPSDVVAVTSTLTGLGMRVVETDPAARRVRVSGTAGLLGRVFGTDLKQVTSGGTTGSATTHRHRTGELSVPAALDGIVTAVLGLDDRPQSRANFRIAIPAAVTTSYTPLELGSVYRFPAGTDGTGQNIAIIELGGGFAQTDLDTYFQGLGVTGPTVTAVSVDGAKNQPGQDPKGADGEVLLDIEVIGALAPAAGIVVYFAPNTDAGFVDAVSQAAHATPTPTAISISWGQSEDDWTAQARTALDQAFTDAALLGVTVTVAAGDGGSSDRSTDGKAHVDFPASSPHALACGGTSLKANPATGAVSAETVWNDGANQGATGGGVSNAFGLPAWQSKAGVPTVAGKPGRGVPDVAGAADPQTGYKVRVDGTDMVIGGTSAVAPLWAALVARLAQATGRRLGLLQPAIYGAVAAGSVAAGFRDITAGDNGAYSAGPGWDACTGLGVPDGTALLAALKSGAPKA